MESADDVYVSVSDGHPELGFQYSPPRKSDRDFDLSDNRIQKELENLDVKGGNETENGSVGVEEVEDAGKREESEGGENGDSSIGGESLKENEEEYESEGENLGGGGDDDGVGKNVERNEKKYQYPLRSDAEDCGYYLKYGTCKFGSSCKFNHPVRSKNQVTKTKLNDHEDSSDQWRHTECKNEKKCPYFMRTGSCNYGSFCKFNHPDPTAVAVSDTTARYGNVGSGSLHVPSQPAISSWSSLRMLNDSAPFVPLMLNPNQPQEWNGYQGPVYPSDRTMLPPPSYAMCNLATEARVYPPQQQHMRVEEFPERPGRPECSYFMKTGDCKFKFNCQLHHPKNRTTKSALCNLSDKGLPLRPDQNICMHYRRYGICKFGPACKFDHPINLSGGDDQHPLSQRETAMAHSEGLNNTIIQQTV